MLQTCCFTQTYLYLFFFQISVVPIPFLLVEPHTLVALSSVCYQNSDVVPLATFSTRGCGRTFHHIKEGLSDLTLAADVALYHCAALAVRGASQDSCWKSLQGSLLALQEGGRQPAGNPKCSHGGFLKCGYPKMVGLEWKILLFGNHHIKNPVGLRDLKGVD